MTSLRVLIADDQELVRLGLRMVIDSQPDLAVVGEAADGAEAVAAHAALAPDVLLMDIRMPALDGISATRAILAQDPDARVLLVTTFDREDYEQPAVAAGACGLLLKDIPPDRLLDAIRSLARDTPRVPVLAGGEAARGNG